MNIRIGNDITLNVTLDAGKMQGKTLLKAQGYLVQDKLPTNVLSPKSYIPTEYTIHGCGVPHYNVNAGAFPHNRGFVVCDQCCKKPNDKTIPTQVVSNTELVCTFPKQMQKHLGRHNLIVEVGVQDDKGVYTYTFDYGSVFSLTDQLFGKTGDIQISIPNVSGSIRSIEGANKTVAILQGDSLSTGSDDYYGFKYGILARLQDMSIVEYDPSDWIYSNIKFKSSDPYVVTVDEYGTITAKPSKISRDVIVTAYDEDDYLTNFDFVVHVVGSDSDETAQSYATQVYDPIQNMNQSKINSAILGKISAIENLVGKTVDGMYIVVTTQNRYDQLVSLNQVLDNTFYFTYDDGEESPDVPVPSGDSSVQNHVLYTSGVVTGGTLTISGTVNNHTLIL